MDAGGQVCGVGRAIVRWLFLFVDQACFFIVGLIVVTGDASPPTGRRHDRGHVRRGEPPTSAGRSWRRSRRRRTRTRARVDGRRRHRARRHGARRRRLRRNRRGARATTGVGHRTAAAPDRPYRPHRRRAPAPLRRGRASARPHRRPGVRHPRPHRPAPPAPPAPTPPAPARSPGPEHAARGARAQRRIVVGQGARRRDQPDEQ